MFTVRHGRHMVTQHMVHLVLVAALPTPATAIKRTELTAVVEVQHGQVMAIKRTELTAVAAARLVVDMEIRPIVIKR